MKGALRYRRGRGKSKALSWFNYPLTCCWKLWIPRARTVRIFHCHLLYRPSTTSSTSIVKGCSLVSRAGRKRIFKQRGNCLSSSRAEIFLPRASSFLRKRDGEGDATSLDASPDALGFASWINLRLIIKTTEFTRNGGRVGRKSNTLDLQYYILSYVVYIIYYIILFCVHS